MLVKLKNFNKKICIALFMGVVMFLCFCGVAKTFAYSYDSESNELVTTNLVDFNKCKFNYGLGSNGEVIYLQNAYVSDFIPIKANTFYTLSGTSNYYIYYYDGNGNFLSYYNYSDGTFSYPYDCLIRFNSNIQGYEKPMLNIGSSALPYEPYINIIDLNDYDFVNSSSYYASVWNGAYLTSYGRINPKYNFDYESVEAPNNSTLLSMRKIADSIHESTTAFGGFSIKNLYKIPMSQVSLSYSMINSFANGNTMYIRYKSIKDDSDRSFSTYYFNQELNLSGFINPSTLSDFMSLNLNPNEVYIYQIDFFWDNGSVFSGNKDLYFNILQGAEQAYAKGYDAGQKSKDSTINAYKERIITLEEQVAQNFGFKNVFFAMADTPIKVVSNVLNFEIFGANIKQVFLGLISAFGVIFIIKFLLGMRK